MHDAYLVGMNRMNTTMFEGIRWSRDNVLAQTLQNSPVSVSNTSFSPKEGMISIQQTILAVCNRSEAVVTL
jgi:hypothetical protein